MRLNKRQKRVKSLAKLWLFTFIFSVSFCANAQSQKTTINGTVTNAGDGLPIPGVAVIVKGSSTGAVSDFDGNFTIDAKIGDVLSFSYLGMEDKDVKIVSNQISVSMSSSLEDLDEVIVIGYGQVKKKEVTGAVSSVKAEDIEQIVTSDLGTALQGQLAGVNVISSSGQPGAQAEILIRGITTISGSNSPLYVVDGLIQERDPGISPNEIESIDVLKDAASTAIYGTRGAAGVILITTKQGKAGSLSVRASASYGIKRLNGETTRLMNANQQTYFELSGARTSQTNVRPDDEIDIIRLSPNKLQNDTDLFDYIVIDDQPVQDYSVNISGGTDDITYSVTTGLFSNKGTLVNSSFDRFNIRANTTYKHKKLEVRANVSVISEEREFTPGVLVGQIIRYQPNRQDLLGVGPDEAIITPIGDDSNRVNWVLESFENERTREDVRTQTNLSLNYDLIKGLRLTTRFGFSTTNQFEHRFNPFRQFFSPDGRDLSPATSSSVRNDALKRKNYSLDLYATYNFNIDNTHDFTFTGGMTFEDYHTERFSASRSNVLSNSIRVLNGTSENPNVGSGPDFRHRIQGVIGRIQYGYKGKYLLSSSVRRDASSRFGIENRSNLFPSIAFAWNISDEPFWNSISNTISSAKFRATYGEVGNESFSDYAYDATITPNIDYVFGTNNINTGSTDVLVNGAIQTGFANSDVKWETSIQTNLGIDLGFFKNKLTLTAEYYDKTNRDMLFPIVTPSSAGGSGRATRTLNIGNMTNKGIEVSAGYRGNIGGLKFRMNGIFSTNKNEITRIEGNGGFILTNDNGLVSQDGGFSTITALAEGYEAGAFFLYTTNGVINTQEELDAYNALGEQAKFGDLIYEDNNNDGRISEADRVYKGSGLPEYEIGYNLNLDYKGFDLSMNWYAALGHEIMNGSKASAFAFGRHEDLVYQWSEVNSSSNIPTFRGISKNHPNYRGYTDLWLEKGDYLRLRQVTLGYSLSKKLTERIGLTRFRLYVSAQNPLTFTNYTGYDPEVGGGISARGLDKGNYPITSQYLLGLNLNF
ncbi:SusC/RagA family TonB-linked outer membrane protein [Flavivirga rizhaonensis]|uniref:TonB-dependent receptor n=1 Tax=Flavivirga rizhaonensis TaxID=2559571 RepID=A0A4S1DXH9_9FLAO|nr:TonB-dependent receptor [Flavivirga rizhaonensis]TGV02971.1 TonB-dependent receptor [Flavivirga rizhaonensis]